MGDSSPAIKEALTTTTTRATTTTTTTTTFTTTVTTTTTTTASTTTQSLSSDASISTTPTVKEKTKIPIDDRKKSYTSSPRVLTEEEQKKIDTDSKFVPKFWREKYVKESQKSWDLFYKRNQINFYKDRHWTQSEFQELVPNFQDNEKKVLFEVGCGVGNTFFPLLESDPNLFVHCCDLSARAINFIKENDLYLETRVNAFVADVTKCALIDNIPPQSVDVATMIFVMSAMHPDNMKEAIKNVFSVLKPGGIVLFRDYGLNDHAMLRFKPGHRLMDRLYVRQDNTLAYYFDIESLQEMFIAEGFKVDRCEYITTETINRKEEKRVDRVFVQARFIRE